MDVFINMHLHSSVHSGYTQTISADPGTRDYKLYQCCIRACKFRHLYCKLRYFALLIKHPGICFVNDLKVNINYTLSIIV